MAVAEARAVLQRTVNRCFVQEDAKRAPKLACCQSSPLTSKLIDTGLTNAADGPEYPPAAVMPVNRSPCTNISPDTEWWLQRQPSYGYLSGLASEQLRTLDSEAETLVSDSVSSTCKFCGAQLEKGVDGMSQVIGDVSDCDFQVYHKGIATGVKKNSDIRNAGLKALHGKTSREHMCEGLKEHYRIADMDPDKFTTSKPIDELCFRSEASWVVCEKTEPWWRMTGRNELASFVAEKSLGYIENCDLPPPQKHVNMDTSACIRHAECNDKWPSSLDPKGPTYGSSCLGMYSPATRSTQKRGSFSTSSEENNSLDSSVKLFSSSSTCKDTVDTQKVFESDPSKAQLLEALRHSQTRAREAEKATMQACAETERVVKLFFREASQLFAYKQWIQLLQLEATYGWKKNDGQQISDDYLEVLPQMPYEATKLEGGHKATKVRQGTGSRPLHDITDFALAFAFGLSLVGAGLILGWTVGYMLRSF